MVVLLLVTQLGGSIVAAGPVGSSTELFSLGDEQASRGQHADALVSYKRAYERLLPQIRGLAFVSEVAPGLMTRSQLEKHLTEMMARQLGAAELTLAQRSLTAFRLVEQAVDLRALLLELLTAEIAGFYDSESKQMFLIDESAAGQGFDAGQSKAVLSHEMQHALADQHFDLEALQQAAHGDDDMGLALGAVIEGEAMVMMMIAGDGDGSDASEIMSRAPEQIALFIDLLRRFLPFASGEAFERAPKVIQESLLFPYLEGMVFILHLTGSGGWSAVDAALRDPPVSTEQILHPSRYRDPRDVPQQLTLPPLQHLLDEGWRDVGRNVHGQLQAAIVVGVPPRSSAVDGWDGDRYAVFVDARNQGTAEGYAWLSTWDSERDAMEFAGAYANWIIDALGHDGAPVRRLLGRDGSWLAVKGQISAVQRVGLDVRIVQGLSLAATERVMGALVDARRQDKVLRRAIAP